MEVAKISSKGQITIPVSVRNKLKLRTGDKIVILEENGRFYFENSAMLAFKRAEDAFAGEAQKAGFETEEDMQEYMKEIQEACCQTSQTAVSKGRIRLLVLNHI